MRFARSTWCTSSKLWDAAPGDELRREKLTEIRSYLDTHCDQRISGSSYCDVGSHKAPLPLVHLETRGLSPMSSPFHEDTAEMR
jgi:hypothetical protein